MLAPRSTTSSTPRSWPAGSDKFFWWKIPGGQDGLVTGQQWKIAHPEDTIIRGAA